MWINLLIAITILFSCNNSATEKEKIILEISKEEKCSVKVPYVEFTKSLNGVKTSSTTEGERLIHKCNAECDNFNDPDGKLSNNTAPV